MFRPGDVSYLRIAALVMDSGGEVTTKPYPEGDLWVAMTRDPAGNAIGIWQHGPRSHAPSADRRIGG